MRRRVQRFRSGSVARYKYQFSASNCMENTARRQIGPSSTPGKSVPATSPRAPIALALAPQRGLRLHRTGGQQLFPVLFERRFRGLEIVGETLHDDAIRKRPAQTDAVDAPIPPQAIRRGVRIGAPDSAAIEAKLKIVFRSAEICRPEGVFIGQSSVPLSCQSPRNRP